MLRIMSCSVLLRPCSCGRILPKPLQNRCYVDGGAEGVRTPDLLNAIQALYQLSYDPIRGGGKCKTSPVFVKTNLNQFEPI